MIRLLVATLLVLTLPATSWTLGTTMEIGVRGGSDASGVDENYTVGEVYFLHALPWQKEFSSGTKIYTRLDVGAGFLHAASKDAGWLAVGGNVVFSLMEGRWELECGFRPTWLFRDEFGEDDYGGTVQFASHAGVTFNLGPAALSYRILHLSNAHLYDPNPGLNLHLVGVGVRF